MEDLNLPIFREKPHKVKRLTMDEYLRFVTDNLRYTIDIAVCRKLNKHLFVGERFILK